MEATLLGAEHFARTVLGFVSVHTERLRGRGNPDPTMEPGCRASRVHCTRSSVADGVSPGELSHQSGGQISSAAAAMQLSTFSCQLDFSSNLAAIKQLQVRPAMAEKLTGSPN